MDESIVSITQAPNNMKAVFKDELSDLYELRVVCVGLTDTGCAGLMVTTDDGHVVFVDEVQASLIGIYVGDELEIA
ncbi:hypothetical protein ACTWQB_09435 [Piscibacillus sp. B03]|uniref:hypothetical protein n=1 Tax=Piscibacillus sp. B03 TaxID=3457430 RepID=UPI003FCE2582